MPILSPEQLTGRVRSHVMELLEPRCTLHPAATQAFLGLRAEAAQSGIDLWAASSFRDFDRQLAIWNDKFLGRRPLLDAAGRPLDHASLDDGQRIRAILIWSALPGASRHHWGTEIDVIDRAALATGQQAQMVRQEYAPGGVFEKLGDWLSHHCARFGFFHPYNIDRGGVQPEPWHLSFAPLSVPALSQLTVAVLQNALDAVDLAGGKLVRAQLGDLHRRYVASVAAPTPDALAGSPGGNPDQSCSQAFLK
jgi:LAS superfamily LD-carboxypeptidase LdcB